MTSKHSKTGSKIQRYSVKAQVKLSNTKETVEPEEITDAKARLKATKNFTTGLGTIANNLFLAQNEESRLLTQLSDRLASVNILSSEDKFSIFVNNMGRVTLNIQEIQQMYLINMQDQLITPLTEFNKNSIGNCQLLKLNLKTKKGQYDMKKKNEVKILKTQQSKNVNLQKVHIARSKSILKFDELESIRNAFISAVQDMEKEKLCLVNIFQQYIDSFAAYAEIHAQNLKVQDKMHWMPPNINNKFGLDSDTEDINDNDETMSTFTDWGKSSIIVREGWIKKRGKVNKSFKKRWFKLFVNKKLIYLKNSGKNAAIKGHINLNKIIGLHNKHDKYIDINTKTRLWSLQFETITDRDGWYTAIMETKGTTMRQTAIDFGETFVDNYYNKNSYDNFSPVSTPNDNNNGSGMPPPPATYEEEIWDDSNPFLNVNTGGLPSPQLSYDEIDDVHVEIDNGKIIAGREAPAEQILNEINPVFNDEGDDEKNETQIIEANEVQNNGLVMEEMKFMIVVDGVGLYKDKELTKETFSVQIENGEIVEGQYIDTKVILLNTYLLYVSAMDIVQVPEQYTEDDNFV